MKRVVCSLVFLLLFIGFFHPVYSITQDLGRHLKTGEIILETHSVPKTNLFSYTYPNFPFINHHWLSEVFYHVLFQLRGFNGLLIINTGLALLSFGLILSKVFKKAGIISLLFCSLLYIPILFERTDVRPEFFSFLFLSLFIVILYRFRSYYHPEQSEGYHGILRKAQNDKAYYLIFLLPFMELLWVNTHIYFPIGIVIILFFLIDAIIPVMLNSFQHPKKEIPKRVWNDITILMLILLVSALITLLNPNGLKGALYPLSVFQNYGYSIEENQNIFFLWSIIHKQSIIFFFIAAPILFMSLILSFKRVLPVDWLISIFFTILAILSIRNFPLFVLATFIPFVTYASNIKLFALKKHIQIVLLVLLLFLALFETQQIYVKKGFGFGVEKGARDAVDFFIKENLKGPIFNNFDIGSYLDYRLYPKEKVFVDGRPEAYPASFFRSDYIPMQIDKSKFESMDQKYNFNTIFFSHTDQTPWAEEFLKQILENKAWNLVYVDDYVVILSKNNTKPIIQTDYSNIRSLIQLARFFQLVNFEGEEIKIYQKILSINPHYCPVLYNLAVKLQIKNDPSFTIFMSRFQQNCQ